MKGFFRYFREAWVLNKSDPTTYNKDFFENGAKTYKDQCWREVWAEAASIFKAAETERDDP